MNIVFLSDSLHFGGKERQIVELLSILPIITAHRFCLILKDGICDYTLPANDKLTVIAPKQRLTLYEYSLLLKKIFSKNKPDVVHAWEGGVALAANIVRLTLGQRFLMIDGSLRYAKKFGVLSKTALVNRANAFLSHVVVANTRAGLAAARFREGGKFRVIGNGINFSIVPKKNVVKNISDPLQIVMIGGFKPSKDQYTLVKAMISLLDEGINASLLLIGDGPERTQVEKAIPIQFKSKIQFTGNMPMKAIWKQLSKSDIGMLLCKKGHSEGMSNAIMEYMAVGIPVICTDTGGNIELIENNLNGYRVPFEDVERVKGKLRELIIDREKRLSMGMMSKKIAQERFSIQRVANEYCRIYNLER